MAESRLMTAEGMEELRAELDRLVTEERAKVVEQIKTAREWGDLKENSEYHAAKDAQSRLETRILRLREKLLNAEVVEAGAASDGTAALAQPSPSRTSEAARLRASGWSPPMTRTRRRGRCRSNRPSELP